MCTVRTEKPPGSLQVLVFLLLPYVAVLNYVSDEVFLPSWANSGHGSKKVHFT